MTGAIAVDRRTRLVAALERRLRREAPDLARAPLIPLPDTGLAHDHVAIDGTGLLARIPKQSQMRLAARDNLAYQAACFDRAAPSRHTPRLHRVLHPDDDLPRGALIVSHVDGRPARLPGDLPAIAQALAAIHARPLPPPASRAPLLAPADPLVDLIVEIGRQFDEADAATTPPHVRTVVRDGIVELSRLAEFPRRPPVCLISFDAHPGNFLITADGRAVLVDLEKARYAYAPLDLAHATLYTSTTWDMATSTELSLAETDAFYRAWLDLAPTSLSASSRAWIGPLRRAMWLWSLTWCAKWQTRSPWARTGTADGEDWSADNSERALIAHVRDRVGCYLSADIVDRVRDGIAALERSLAD